MSESNWQRRAEKAERERNELQASLDRLYGARFSDRCYAALRSRAETAERQLAVMREALEEARKLLQYATPPSWAPKLSAALASDAGKPAAEE